MSNFRHARREMESKLEELTSMNTKLGKELKEVSAELGQTKLANQAGTSEIVQLHATIAELQGALL
jgi:chromosome segregation ATPase